MQSIIFRNRIDAANKLAEKLLWLLKKEQSDSSIVVLSIPRGGVVVGDVVAAKLNTKLDILVSRKIGAPDNPEFAIGAVMPDGTYFLNENDDMLTFNITQSYIDAEVNVQTKEIERRLMSFRGSKEYDNQLKGKAVILVDDGIATGATILSAVQWLKTKQNCQELIIAVPVAPNDTVDRLKQIIGNNERVIVLYSPEPFIAVGRFYQDFRQVSDDEVKTIMKRHGYNVDNST
jgi:putative phosphoribosyl transferase